MIDGLLEDAVEKGFPNYFVSTKSASSIQFVVLMLAS